MQVADEVDDVTQRFGALAWFGGFALEDCDLSGQGFVDAAFFAAIGSEFAINALTRHGARNVNVMPRAVASFGANVVGPGGGVSHGVVDGGAAVAFELGINGIVFEQGEDKFFSFGREMFFGNQSDGFVAFAAPGASG